MSSSSEVAESSSSSSSSRTDEEALAKLKPPKPPLRANNFYIRKNFQEAALRLGPHAKPSDIFAALNEEWMRLGEKERKPFVDQATAEKERYTKELGIYRAKYAVAKRNPSARPPKRKFAGRDPKLPKRIVSALQFYIRKYYIDRQLAHVQARREHLMRMLKREWMGMSDEQRAPFKKLHEDDQKRYQDEMLAYHRRKTEEHQQEREEEQEQERLEQEARDRRWYSGCRLL